MAKTKPEQSRLLNLTAFDTRDDLEEKLDKCYRNVTNLIANLSEKQANDALNAYVGRGSPQHEEIQLGLFYSIIRDPTSAPRSYRDLSLISRDGLTSAMTKTNQLIHEKWLKLQDGPRAQIVWFCKELTKNGVLGSDSICHSLLRQISGGDVTPKNIWLAESVLDIFVENKVFLEKIAGLMPTAVYTFLRIILDHNSPNIAALRQREVDFCVQVLREKWTECMQIGRDLVRLLQYVARIPEFEVLWRDIMHNPTSLSPTFTGLVQLMRIRTSRKYFISRMTPDMENKLNFLITKIKFGNHKRYQDWFQRQYLSTPESQSLRCDLIRFICAVFHPPNELLCSDIIPRWAVIGWLLTTCTSNVAASNAKLALFYDWLFFDKDKDSIMNIEPAMLVMTNSLRPHPAITATLLDFLCRIMNNFCPALHTNVKQGIFSALRTILDKRVLPSLSPLFDSNKLDKELRHMVRENFAEFCTIEVKEDPVVNNKKEVVILEQGNNHVSNSVNSSDVSLLDAEFSDEDEDTSLGKIRSEMTFRPIKEGPKFEIIDITEYVEQLEGEIKECIIDLQNQSNSEAQCEVMERLVQAVIQDDDFDNDTAATLATCLCQLLHGSQFTENIFPTEVDDESLEDSIGTPFFVLFRNLCQIAEEDPNRQSLLLLIGEMYDKQHRVGYHLIYFLKIGSKGGDEKMTTYKDFCKNAEGKDLSSCLLTDVRLCAEDDVRLFTFLIPDIYTHFSNIAVGSSEILQLIVSIIDGSQLQDLVCQIMRGHLIVFRKDSFVSVLNGSLEWETIEQYFLWQLIAAHNIPVEHIMPVLPKLNYALHAEALTSILIKLKEESPTDNLLKPILCRPCRKSDMFSIAIINHWAQEHEDKLTDLLNIQLTKINTTPNRKRQSRSSASNTKKDKDQPTVEQILAHLDLIRQTCKNISFLTNETLQQAFQFVQATGAESLKTKYSDLLALAEDFEDVRTTRVLRGRKASNLSPKTTRTRRSPAVSVPNNSGSSSESSEDEEVVKPRTKKRRRAVAADDDSD